MPLCVHNTAVRFWSCNACVRSLRHALSTGVTLALAAPLMTAAAPMPAQMRIYLIFLCGVTASLAFLNPGHSRALTQAIMNTSEASQILANINAMPLVPPPEDMPVLHTGVTNAVFHLLYTFDIANNCTVRRWQQFLCLDGVTDAGSSANLAISVLFRAFLDLYRGCLSFSHLLLRECLWNACLIISMIVDVWSWMRSCIL